MKFACFFILFACAALDAAEADNRPGIEFFEKHIRPVLVESCYKCHSSQAEKLKGGLLLDSREALLKGGDTGPALVPGDPDKSLLIRAIRYTDENLQMPPKNKKLAPAQIADFEAWVKMGAPDPRAEGSPNKLHAAEDRAKNHWGFQPVRAVTPPAVKDRKWLKTTVDNFIEAKLEEKKLSGSATADKRTLLRRAYFDLTGLPPTLQDLEQFTEDHSPGAWNRVIDRLLESPLYGERWGRYWLDIARYADTKGYVFEEERRYPYAYTYRDYVIRAFNEDLPFNQFIVEQVAADQLPLAEDKRSLAALGFLTLGRRFLNNSADIIDDRIDVISRGVMGLTVSCARCHDHKFDPIPTRDYYSMYGVLANSHEPAEPPLLGTKPEGAVYKEYLAEHAKREKELEEFRAAKLAESRGKVRHQVGDYLLVAHDARPLADPAKQEALVRQRKLDPGIFHNWRDYLSKAESASNALFAPWLSLAQQENSSNRVDLSTLGPGNSFILSRLTNAPSLTNLQGVAARYNDIFREVDESSKTNKAFLADPAQEQIQTFLYAKTSPVHLADDQVPRLFDVPTAQKVRALKRKLDELDASHPGAPPRAMALVDNKSLTPAHVFVRGNPGNPGAEVPRQFLAVLSAPERKPFAQGSGRLELARAMVDPRNPLTARVIVNRIWLHHFGTPLVRTPSDFGLRSEPPSHPELLDYLALRFMEEGWSIKKLHRLLMTSAVYQQRSDSNPRGLKVDPGNTLFWRMNRQRLDFEALRDSLLAVSSNLDLTIGGHAVDIVKEPSSPRRTIYGFIDRQNLPGIFRTFDFASPDTTSPQRFFTTVPQQALFLLNSPFLISQARGLMKRVESGNFLTDEEKIRALHQITLQRLPKPEEMLLAKNFLKATQPKLEGEGAAGIADDPKSRDAKSGAPEKALEKKGEAHLSPLEQYAQVLLLSNEFVFVD